MDKIIRYPYSLINYSKKEAYISGFLVLLYLGYLVYKRRRRLAFMCYLDRIRYTKKYIFKKIKGELFLPKIGIILGSGQNELVKNFTIIGEIAYKDIPFFPVSTVRGHKGRLLLARYNKNDIIIMQGRFHGYEGYSTKEVSYPVRVMKSLGVKTLIITNSSGGINQSYCQGDIIVVKDHIYLPGLVGFSPLMGKNEEELGDRFLALNNVYNKFYRKMIVKIAAASNMTNVKEGVYCGVAGPCYETPTEVKLVRTLGGDIVGMSTVPEVVVAAHSSMSVLVLGLVTNECIDNCDSDNKPTHKEVCDNAKDGISDLRYLIEKFLKCLNEDELLSLISLRKSKSDFLSRDKKKRLLSSNFNRNRVQMIDRAKSNTLLNL